MQVDGFDLPDETAVDLHKATGFIRLSFGYDDKGPVSVHLNPAMALDLVSQVLRKTEHKTVVPIPRPLLAQGTDIEVEGIRFGKFSDGDLRIELLARVEDRFVTIPLRLSPKEVAELRNIIVAND